MKERWVPRPVALAVCLVLVATASLMTVRSVALSADGPYFLVRILETERVFSFDARLFGNAVRQSPVLLAARSGVTDTYLLTVMLGVGQLVLPALAWSLATLQSRAHVLAFTAVAMSAGLGAGSTWFLSVNESVLATPLSVLVGVLLWRAQAWRWRHAVLAIAASFVLVASYESALGPGIVLAVWAGWRAVEARSVPERYGSAIVALLSTLSVVVAIVGTATGPGPTSSRSSLYFIVSGKPWQLYAALLGVAAVISALTPHRLASCVRWTVFVLGGSCATLAILDLPATPVAGFQARGGAALAVLPLLLLLWWLWHRDRRRVAPDTPLRPTLVETTRSRWFVYLLPVVFVGAAALSSLQGLAQWSRSLDAFQAEVNRSTGINRVDEALPRNRRLVVWGWTSTSLSLILRRDANAGILVDPSPSYVPFPPSTAHDQLPERYVWRR